MVTCDNERLRRLPPCRPRSRATHARVAGPLTLSALAVLATAAGCWLLGLPPVATLVAVGLVAVLAAIASRRTVSSLVAGAAVRVAQPYEPGEQIRVFVPSLGSVEDAEIVRVGPANTTLMTASGIVLIPNAHMLRGTAHTR